MTGKAYNPIPSPALPLKGRRQDFSLALEMTKENRNDERKSRGIPET